MTLSEMRSNIIKALSVELKGDDTFSEKLLEVKVDGAISDVKRARYYPSSYSDEMIESDLVRFESNIRNIALYDYNLIGVEGQTSSSENGENRSYVDRNKLFSGVIPLSR